MMTNKYNNRYRIPSARAAWWNYGWSGAYFITICTRQRRHFFGRVSNHKMELSPIGRIAENCWHEIPNHFPFVGLGEFVVMPDHIHGIIIIDHPVVGAPVETQDFASLRGAQPHNQFGPQSKNLASIVRGYKTGVTKNARLIRPEFAWQARYHDRIIRDDRSHDQIAWYIRTNPARWGKGKDPKS